MKKQHTAVAGISEIDFCLFNLADQQTDRQHDRENEKQNNKMNTTEWMN